MKCPKCFGDDVTIIGTSHYVCNNPNCTHNGVRTQFRFIVDNKIHFPYNQIFVNRNVNEFYRKPYLKLESIGSTNINR